MCGIFALFGEVALSKDAQNGLDSLVHRGPDGSGSWTDPVDQIYLGHRRLAILDISENGHQPMGSDCGRYMVTYNGEIYNHLEIRETLRSDNCNHKWLSTSDTETLVAAIQHWGVQDAISNFNGMFAFSVWDSKRKELTIVRDRLGEKPVYYGQSENGFVVGSELKVFDSISDWPKVINRNALASFIRHGYVCSPQSIFENIKKIKPGHYVKISGFGKNVSKQIPYWSLTDIVTMQSTDAGKFSEADAISELDKTLSHSVKIRMQSDVPLGAFLSGGIDSSLIVALMQKQSEAKIKTFAIGFDDAEFNEAHHAKLVAQHLGTDHNELYVTPQQARDVIPKLPHIYDEPFADSSQIPTFLVSELAKSKVTVALSGDGGDELFCGYNRYNLGYEAWKKFRYTPLRLRLLLAATIRRTPVSAFRVLNTFLPQRLKSSVISDKMLKLADILTLPNANEFYYALISVSNDPTTIVLNSVEDVSIIDGEIYSDNSLDFREKMMLWDSLAYLPDDILTKVDRASMAVSLEGRAPFLDHNLVELAWKLDVSLKSKDHVSKWILKQVLYKYVPQDLVDRPKMGFGIPIEHWLKGPLMEWADDLLSPYRLRQEGYFDADRVLNMWNEHKSGKRRWHYVLWNILMFQAWLENQKI
jgi:asparagine synthase (glutamine-hydrolysing)